MGAGSCSQQLASKGPAVLGGTPQNRNECRSSSSSRTRGRARRSAAASPRRPATSSSSRTPTSSTTRATSPRRSAHPGGRRGRRLRLALPRRAPPRPLLLAHGATTLLTRCPTGHRPQPDRHGDLLQGLPRARSSGRITIEEDASPSSRRSPPRSPAGVPDLRGADQLSRPHLRRGEEDRLEGRRPRRSRIVKYWIEAPQAAMTERGRNILREPGDVRGTPRFNRWMYERVAPYVRGDVLEIGSGIGTLSRLIVADLGERTPAPCCRRQRPW